MEPCGRKAREFCGFGRKPEKGKNMCANRLAKGCFILQITLMTANANAAYRYVRADALPGGNGTTWALAFNTLQGALDVANSGDLIWVKKGVYYPTNQSTPINLTDNTFSVKVHGGFRGQTGDEEIDSPVTRPPDPDPSTPDPLTDSILSGDLGTPGDPSDNALSVVSATGSTNTTELDSFTITAGNGGDGAGLYLGSGSNLKIQKCRFLGNQSTSSGGGIYVGLSSSPGISDCLFKNNMAQIGGAIFFRDATLSTIPLIERCRFVGNTATASAGAIRFGQSGSATTQGLLRVVSCLFIDNEAQGISNSGGGAVRFGAPSRCDFTNCVF